MKPISIGPLTAFALRDGTLEFPNDNTVFGVGHTPEEVAPVLAAAGAPTDTLETSSRQSTRNTKKKCSPSSPPELTKPVDATASIRAVGGIARKRQTAGAGTSAC